MDLLIKGDHITLRAGVYYSIIDHTRYMTVNIKNFMIQFILIRQDLFQI